MPAELLRARDRRALPRAADLRRARRDRAATGSRGWPKRSVDPDARARDLPVDRAVAVQADHRRAGRGRADRRHASGMALEKPLGTDLASSREINDAVAAAFPEERTFRIDHYLGKETVQNLLALRFANSMFEPLWNCGPYRPCPDHASPRPSGSRGAAIIMTAPARCATWSRTTCCSCSRWWRWSRRPTSTRPRCATKRSRCCARCGRSRPTTSRRMSSPANMARARSTASRSRLCRGTGQGIDDRDLRRAQGACRQLALDGRALLPAHRQAHGRAPDRDLHPVQVRAAFDLRRARGADRSPTS